MTQNELQVLHRCMAESKCYLEFGAGDSTRRAVALPNLGRIDSVESSPAFIRDHVLVDESVQLACQSGRLRFQLVDIGETAMWGYPRHVDKRHLWPNYALAVFAEPSRHDLVLVDGRFRVACALNALLNTPDDCRILIHDFWNRPWYHGVLPHFRVEARVDTLAVLRKPVAIDRAEVQRLITIHQYLPDDRAWTPPDA